VTRRRGRPTEEPILPDDETSLRSAVHAAYIEVGKGKIDRTFRAADFVTRAAGTIATIYTGLLALVYSVGSNPPRPLPARGIAPAAFLALAFFFSVASVAFVRTSTKRVHILPLAETALEQERRLIRFLQWIERGNRRTWALRAAVICLGAGVALLPLPFISLARWQTGVAIGAALAVVLFWLLWELYLEHRARTQRAAKKASP
jgi:hypothetical protein